MQVRRWSKARKRGRFQWLEPGGRRPVNIDDAPSGAGQRAKHFKLQL